MVKAGLKLAKKTVKTRQKSAKRTYLSQISVKKLLKNRQNQLEITRKLTKLAKSLKDHSNLGKIIWKISQKWVKIGENWFKWAKRGSKEGRNDD